MIEYDPFSDTVMRDPWPYYAELRERAPVFYFEKYDTWFLSRFEDIWASTTNDLFSAERGVTPEMVLLKAAPPPDPVFSMLDMPRQRPYRRLLSAPYTRRAVAGLEEKIRSAVRAKLAPLLEAGSFDVYRDLANPIATEIIGEVIGLPEGETLPLRGTIKRYFARVPGQVGTTPEADQLRIETLTRFGEIVEESSKSLDPDAEDHISVMLRARIDGEPLDVGAIVAAIYTMLVTGAEVVPLAVAIVFRRPAFWFVAWFCVVANSLYLFLGYFSSDPELDSTKMLRSGTPGFVLVGVASIGLLIGYLRFRACCVDLLSGKSARGNRRVLVVSATVLMGVLTLQSIAGRLLLRL